MAAGLSQGGGRRGGGGARSGRKVEVTRGEGKRSRGGEGDGNGGFIGDVSIATARLIRRYELLLAALSTGYTLRQRFPPWAL